MVGVELLLRNLYERSSCLHRGGIFETGFLFLFAMTMTRVKYFSTRIFSPKNIDPSLLISTRDFLFIFFLCLQLALWLTFIMILVVSFVFSVEINTGINYGWKNSFPYVKRCNSYHCVKEVRKVNYLLR